jgi:hypothetical protein
VFGAVGKRVDQPIRTPPPLDPVRDAALAWMADYDLAAGGGLAGGLLHAASLGTPAWKTLRTDYWICFGQLLELGAGCGQLHEMGGRIQPPAACLSSPGVSCRCVSFFSISLRG